MLVYDELLGIKLPSYDEHYVNPADREVVSALINGHRGSWREVSEPKILDLILMTEAGIPRHIGVVAGGGRLLHMVPGHDSVIEPYTTGKIKHRVAGFFRHESRL